MTLPPKKLMDHLLVLILSLVIDQWIKIYVKTHFIYGESYTLINDWFRIYFIENEGMAFGMTLFGGGKTGKLILTFFRIIVSLFGFLYLYCPSSSYPGTALDRHSFNARAEAHREQRRTHRKEDKTRA